MMNKFKQIFLQCSVVLLIFLITSQIVIIKGKEIPFPLKLPASRLLASPVSILSSSDIDNSISFELIILQGFAIGELRIIINGDKVIKITSEQIKIFVQSGDMIWLDARLAKEPIWIRVAKSDLDSGLFLKGTELRIFKEIIFLGEVSCFGRL